MTTVEKIKAKILDLAIRGKLVPQDPNDEPASELLKRIRAEKEELVKAKKIKKEKDPSEIVIGSDGRPYEKFADGKTVCIEDEVPFDLPHGWAWTRLESICDILDSSRKPVTKKDRVAGPYPYYGATCIQDYVAEYIFDEPLVLLGEDGAKWDAGERSAFTISGKTWVNNHAHVLRPLGGTEHNFICYCLNSLDLMDFVTGTTVPKLNQDKMRAILIPIAPLTEQKRIVTKIEELFTDAEKIAMAQDGIIRTAERINKKVLDLAIRGQLVPQDPNDEPAEELLKRIAEARQRNASKKSRKSKCEESVIFYGADRSAYETRNGKTVCIDDEIPFDTPDSWAWARLGDIFQHNTGKALNRNSSEGEFKEYITTSNVYSDEFKLDTLKSMRFTEDELDKCTIKEGDLLVCEGGDIGRAAIWNLKREVCIQNHLHRLRPYMEICRSYFCFALRHYKYTNRLQGKGIGLQGFSSGMLHSLLIPFPPLAEQKRIVAKIEEVRKLTRSLTT